MSAPSLSFTAEPYEGGAVVHGPLAPNQSGVQGAGQLSLVLRLTNTGTSQLHLNAVALDFAAPPAPQKTIAADLLLPAGATELWYFQQPDDVVLSLPAPTQLTISLSCDGYSSPAKASFPLAAYAPPAGGYAFPGLAQDMRSGEYWSGRSAAHGAAGGGVQLFAYDLGVLGWDDTTSQWSWLFPGGDGTKNEDYRIWGKPIHAMADGTVQSWDDTQPTNPSPPADLSPPGPVEGNHFYLQHGTDLVLYAHMQKGTLNTDLMTAGAKVTAGDFLGLAGNSGNSSAPHLHIHAIKGTMPWQGPPRPIAFRGVEEVDLTLFSGSSTPWYDDEGLCLPATQTLIWPSRTLPLTLPKRPIQEFAIDPLALILRNDIYVLLHLPDPAPVLAERARALARTMSPAERKQALEAVRAFRAELGAVEKAFAAGKAAART